MSEFKFACPVCGQHITADASASGRSLECPTCFQQLVVPQAPASGDSKLILSATQAGKNRPALPAPGADQSRWRRAPAKTSLAFVGLMLVLLAVFALVWHRWGERAIRRLYPPREASHLTIQAAGPMTSHPVPSNIVWTMDVTNARMPQATLAGKIHGLGFLCDHATLHGGTLSLRQGGGWPPELAVTIFLPIQAGEDLSRKVFVVPPTQPPPVPRITLRWRDEKQAPVSTHIHSGYALKIIFGQAASGRLPGRLYLALPDETHSFAAGDFQAEIRPARHKP